MTTEDTNAQESESQESAPIKAMRDRIKELEADSARANELERKLAFAQAGVNLETKAGQYFYKGYDGELSTDAIREELGALGLSDAPPPKQQEDEIPADERASTDERGRLATGASNEPHGDNPRITAIESGEKALRDGSTRIDAIGEAFAELAIAGYKNNDKRVIYDPRR